MNDAQYQADDDNEYLLGTGEAELERLGFQHQVWGEWTAALWERAGFAPGQTLIDVGSGPGYTTLDLAELVGRSGKVIAVDVSDRFMAALRARLLQRGIEHVESHLGDLHELELPAAVADGAYMRWVLCYCQDPGRVIANVADALRPGGVVAIQDYYFYETVELVPRSDAFRTVIHAVGDSFRRSGGDLDVGKRIPGLLVDHGFELVDMRPNVRIARPSDALWKWPETFFANYLDVLIGMELVDEDEAEAFRGTWRAHSADPAAFLTTPMMIDVVARKR